MKMPTSLVLLSIFGASVVANDGKKAKGISWKPMRGALRRSKHQHSGNRLRTGASPSRPHQHKMQPINKSESASRCSCKETLERQQIV